MSKISEPSIIGYSSRLPGAYAPSDAWSVFEAGKCNVSKIPEERWSSVQFLDPSGQASDRTYTRCAAVLEDPFAFDASYFGISEAEAVQMDPQQRLVLETTARAFDHAGLDPDQLDKRRTGVFVGASSLDHSGNALQDPGMMNSHFMLGNTMSIISNRIAYQWDFKGPSFTVDTACSSSLFALELARQKIVNGEIDTAVVAGVNLLLSPIPFIGFSRAQMLSKRGLCRAFAKDADGYVRAEGAIVFILQNAGLTRTLGLRSRSTLAACGTNSDGRSHGMALPSSDTQADLISMVMRNAGIDANDLALVEAHGTGTAVGDPAEAKAIGEIYGKGRSAPLPIGSAKSNFGHLEPAAGLLGLLKAQLALEHNKIPATLHVDELNPNIDFDALNLRVQTEAQDIEVREKPWLAAVNSFGFGGANAHAILRQSKPSSDSTTAELPPTLLITAATKAALQDSAANWKKLAASAKPHLPDLVATANRRVGRHDLRLAVNAGDTVQLKESLDRWLTDGDSVAASVQRATRTAAPVVFVFPGNGTVWEGMAREMYMRDGVFRASYDELASMFDDLGVKDLRGKLTDPDIGAELQRAPVAQPMLYAIQVALTDALASAGLQPSATIGHSAGEVAAAVAANRITREDGALIIATRSIAFEPLFETGGMLALAASAVDAQSLIEASGLPIDLAADNAPYSVTVSGSKDDLRNLLRLARKQKVAGRLLDIEYPYHGRSVDQLRSGLLEDLKSISSSESDTKFYSGWMGSDAKAVELDADYWWHNARHSVNFRSAVEAACQAEECVFVEVTPKTVLKSYVRDTVTEVGNTPRIIETLDVNFAADRSAEAIVRSVAAAGGRVDEDKVLGARKAFRAEMPEYPFDRKQFVLSSETGLDHYSRRVSNPILGARRDPSQAVWHGSVSTARHPWLADHVIDGKVLFPATAILEMFAQAISEDTESTRVLLTNVYFLQPIELREDREVATRVTFERTSRTILLKVSRGKGWTIAASATVRTASGLEPNWRLSGPVAKDEPPYKDLAAIGMTYGPKFARVTHIYCEGDQARAKIATDTALPAEAIRIINSDAALHGIAKLLEGRTDPMVPSYIAHADIDLKKSVAHSTARRSSGDIATRFDVECFDESEQPSTRLQGLQVTVMPTVTKKRPGIWVEKLMPVLQRSPSSFADDVGRYMRKADSPVSDADVLRSAIGGRLAWDYVASRDEAGLDADKLDYARRYLADMGLDSEAIAKGAECPWPDINALIELAVQTVPSEVTLLRSALEAASGDDSSGKFHARSASRLASNILTDLASAEPEAFGRIGLIGEVNRAMVESARRLAHHVTVLSTTERGLDEARTKLSGEPNLVFALLGDERLDGSLNCLVGVAAMQNLIGDEALRLADVAATDAELLFVEPAMDCFAVMTGCAEPNADLDQALSALEAKVNFRFTKDEQETGSVIIHATKKAEASLLDGTHERVQFVSIDADLPPEQIGSAMMESILPDQAEPVWMVCRSAERFSELTGWRRTVRNETGNDIRVAQVSKSVGDDELGAVLRSTHEHELNLSNDVVQTSRISELVREPSTERLQLSLSNTKTGYDALSWQKLSRIAPFNGEVEIEVRATALNFRDVMLAQGVLPTDAFEGGFAGPYLGMECAGVVVRSGENAEVAPGTPVVAIAKNAFDTHVTVSERLVVPLPDNMEMPVAAALPVVFLTAEYALQEVARLQLGESVLIHGGAGGVGLACIQLAQRVGAKVFVTAGTPEKRRLMYALGVDGVFDSRELDFDVELRHVNGGKGVDVVVNSLAGEAMERSVACLEPFGRFVELGKRDIIANSQLGLRAMKDNISYHVVDVDQLLKHRPDLAEKVMARVSEALKSGGISPLPVDVFAAADVVSAFRHVQRSQHIGKTVVEAPRLETSVDVLPIRGTWLVTGGTTGFGLKTAEWLADQGATELWLVSRRGKADPEPVERMRSQNVTVHECAVDVTSEVEVEALVQRISAEGHHLNGVVHAAMVMDDGFITQMEPTRCKSVIAPKVDGARHLDTLTRRFDLDHFWLYSSLSARFGNPGQGAYVAANRSLEALAEERRTEGLPGLAIAWGPIDDVGFLSRESDVSNALEQRLGQLMTSSEALDTLGDLLRDGFDGAGVSIGHMPWSKLLRDVPVLSEPLFELLDVREAEEQTGRIKIDALIAEHGPRKARDRVLSLVQKEVAAILHVAPSEVDVLRPLTDVGFDSLMIMNLKLAIEDQIDVDLGVVAVGSDLSLGRIVNNLFEEQRGGDEGEKLVESLAETHLTQSTVDEADRQRILDRLARRGT